MARSTRAGKAASASPPDDPPSRLVLRQFRQIFNAVKTHFRQVENQAGLGGAQVWALGLIGQHPGIGVSELARRMDVHQSTASNLVRTLAAKGLVATGKDEVDRRTVLLTILPAGVRVLRAAPGPFEGVLPEALGALDPALLQRLHADLAVLIDALHAGGADAQTPLADL